MNKKMMVVSASVLIVLVLFIAMFFYSQKKSQEAVDLAQANSAVLNRAHSPVHGNPDAKVTIVEFFDPACETCSAFYPLVKALTDDSFGRVKLVMRYAPLHKGSDEVVKILEAARLQNLYWQVLEAMLKSQSAWVLHHQAQPALVWAQLTATGLDVNKARLDMSDPRVLQVVAQDIADGVTMEVNQTPGYFVNGKPLTEFGWEQLKALVATEVRSSYAR